MSDRLLALTLALCLALPLCLNLDGDLFGRNGEGQAHRQVEELLEAGIAKQSPTHTRELIEQSDGNDGAAARQLPVLVLGAMQQRAVGPSKPNVQSDPAPASSNSR